MDNGNDKEFTIREACDESLRLGFKRSRQWWKMMIDRGFIKTRMEERDIRGVKRVHLISLTEFARVIHEKPKLKLKAVMILCLFLLAQPNAWAAKKVYQGKASYYSTEQCRYNKDPKCPMANGRSIYDVLKKQEPYAAMWDVPLGARVKVTNTKNGKHAVLEVMDRGPSKRLKGRVIDLDKETFKQLADPKDGLIPVKVEVMNVPRR